MQTYQLDMLGDTQYVRPLELPSMATCRAEVLPHVTSVVANVSGGIDSFAAVLWGLAQLADAGVDLTQIPIYLFHSYLAGTSWPQDIDMITAFRDLYYVKTGIWMDIQVWQAVYELTGGKTEGGFNATTLRRMHCVRDGEIWHGPAGDDDDSVIRSLLELTDRARLGWPPTMSTRYCTSYFKIRTCQTWSRDIAPQKLGALPLLISGERHSESSNRAALPEFNWELGNKGWDMLHWRPCIEWEFRKAFVNVFLFGGKDMIHPCYFLQSPYDDDTTIDRMADPSMTEKGRPRCSCVLCIFTLWVHIQYALEKAPEFLLPRVQELASYERKWGRTWQQPKMREKTQKRLFMTDVFQLEEGSKC